MGLLSRLFGNGRLETAEAYVESQWNSGLTRHYDVLDVQDCIESQAGVKVNEQEAIAIVQKVRARRGWAPRPLSDFYSEEE